MQDLLDVIIKKTPDVKVQRVCCGCNLQEPKDEPFQKCCPQCHREKLVPALFCSQECFQNAWPRHKQWHQEKVPFFKEGVARCQIPIFAPEDPSQYVALLCASNKKTFSGDFNGAKKLVRKALKLDTSRVEAYTILGETYWLSGQTEEAKSCFKESIKKEAFVALTGCNGDIIVTANAVYLTLWARSVQFLCKGYRSIADNDEIQTPNWLCHDGMIKRITKVALNASSNEGLVLKLSYTRAHVLFRKFKVLQQCPSHWQQYMNDPNNLNRTAEELQEAATLYQFVSQRKDELTEVATELSDQASAFAEMVSSWEPSKRTALEKGEAGIWVVMHGFEAQAGKDMNGKFGLIFKDGLEHGRVAVEADGHPGEERVHPQNLWQVPFSEMDLALISTLDEGVQWKYVRASRELLLARFLAGFLEEEEFQQLMEKWHTQVSEFCVKVT
ncbi:expressed unknown protein [Seminavis robusta]|uniref:C6H2-type domain-containing protein n=1 Tax=Seminavis robusta TaxID=568900 RepID=A0A9N8H7E5_9STRA|nr:expressed unknown protein [Seminavis robusta]|eukprot:Sro201_g085130.1 n/a (443) ;mRNA; r:58779-60107